MYNVNDVKEKLCDYLLQMDITRLNMVDLMSYASVVRTLDEISRPNYQEQLASIMSRASYCCETNNLKAVEPHD